MTDESATQHDHGQQNQRTIAAFITGLLVGGLLVWIFATAAGQDNGEAHDHAEDDHSALEDDHDDEHGDDNGPVRPTDDEGQGTALDVHNQPAGNSVEVAYVEYPAGDGWLVVHRTANGELGGAIGATRFDTDAGRFPTSIPLVAPTVAGQTYEVMFYSENGDRQFSTAADRPLLVDGERISTTFTAQ